MQLTIEHEVTAGAILQQAFVVVYKVHNHHCEDCHKVAASNSWQAMVQVRQKVDHKRTFLFLEQVILKHGAHESALSIKSERNG